MKYSVTRWNRSNWASATDSLQMSKAKAVMLAQKCGNNESVIIWLGKPHIGKMVMTYWRDSQGLQYMDY